MAVVPRILIVDDDPHVCELLGIYLKREGFEVRSVGEGSAALREAQEFDPALIVLDLMLPDISGTEVCERLRKRSAVPIMMLTARTEEEDRVLGLELGADDYVVKPFSPREVVARVKAILRRAEPEEAAERVELPGLVIDIKGGVAHAGGRRLSLTPTEFRLLTEFALHPNEVLTREVLLQRVWGFELLPDYQRTVDTHVRRLRSKLAEAGPLPFSINTQWGMGYRLEVEPEGGGQGGGAESRSDKD